MCSVHPSHLIARFDPSGPTLEGTPSRTHPRTLLAHSWLYILFGVLFTTYTVYTTAGTSVVELNLSSV